MRVQTETTSTGIELRTETDPVGESKYFVNDVEVSYYRYHKTETEEYLEYKIKDNILSQSAN
jgi:hypothetical protein